VDSSQGLAACGPNNK